MCGTVSNLRLFLLVTLLLLACMTLSAQVPQGIAKTIIVEFDQLTNNSSYEELKAFLDDYQQYQLKIVYWFVIDSVPTNHAYCIFNSTMIGENEILNDLNTDQRVYWAFRPFFTDLPLPRQLAIKLVNDEYEEALLLDYADYGLAGSLDYIGFSYFAGQYWFYEEGIRFYTFDYTSIYTGDLLDLLRDDNRVDIIFQSHEWHDGRLDISLNTVEDKDSLIEDYPYIDFTFSSSVSENGTAIFNIIEYNEFDIRDQLMLDARLSVVSFQNWYERDGFMTMYIRLRPQEPPPTSEDDVTILPKLSIVSYPNPVLDSDVTFHIRSENENNRKKSSMSELRIYNIRGQLVKSTSFEGDTFVWNRRDMNNREVTSGVYFYKVTSENMSQTKRMVLLK